MKETVKNHLRPARLTLLAVLCLGTAVLLVKPSSATGIITKADLSGPWQISLTGNTGCGLMTMLVNATLNSTGSGSATITTHGQCGDTKLTAQSFTINSLSSNGSGTAGLSCGSGCGWVFNIQVAPDRSIFNLVDVDSANPDNFVEGIAIHQ